MFDSKAFQGKRILITAGASGLGWAMAETFLQCGGQVLVCDVDDEALKKVADRSERLHVTHADVSDEASVAKLFDTVKETLGGLDVLVNNAGIAGPTGLVETLNKADWDRTLAVNITGQFLCARLAIPMLKESRGVIINLSSAAGHLGFAGRSAYSASKWGVVGFTKTLAIELGPHGVRANAVLPGAVEGPRIRAVIAAKAQTLGKPVEEVASAYEKQASLGRMVSAQDVANMVVFAASDAAAMVSGQAMVVDGHTQMLI